MRVLVTWGSKHGGTEGIAHAIGDELEVRGFDVVTGSAKNIQDLDAFDAVIVGGALYAGQWHRTARRFVNRFVTSLQKVPVWFFSSGPLDDSADRKEILTIPQVTVLAERVGAHGHVTFGGRLEPDVKGFPESAMAKKYSGDWRNVDRIRAWAGEVANELPTAKPGTPIDHPARSSWRLLVHGLVGWALCTIPVVVLLALGGSTLAAVVHAIVTPVFFIAIAHHYFSKHGAREPLPTAVAWTALVAVLDLAIVAAVMRSLEMFGSVVGTWLPLVSIFLATWATGTIMTIKAGIPIDTEGPVIEPEHELSKPKQPV